MSDYLNDEYGFPLKPCDAGGKPALQVWNEALVQEEAHQQWHCDNPGEMCDPADWPSSYEGIALGEQVMHSIGGNFYAGESFVMKGGK